MLSQLQRAVPATMRTCFGTRKLLQMVKAINQSNASVSKHNQPKRYGTRPPHVETTRSMKETKQHKRSLASIDLFFFSCLQFVRTLLQRFCGSSLLPQGSGRDTCKLSANSFRLVHFSSRLIESISCPFFLETSDYFDG